MASADPQRQLKADERSRRSIQQTAGDGATQIGEVHGSVYIGSPAPEAEVPLDLGAYLEHQLSQFAIWERQYTRLDVDPAVALPGQDLRPVPDSRLPLTEAFLRHERLIVVGGAGAGKTTSMLYLVASVLPGGSLAGDLEDFIPVYIELGRFRTAALTSPLDHLLILIAETLSQGKALMETPSLRRIRQILESHRFLFLLDGLNETQADLRASCLTAIEDLADLYSKHRIVFSSRPHGFSPPESWDVVLLRELEGSQISEFLERRSQKETTQTILQTAAQNPLLRVPLFLHLVATMSGSPLPIDHQRLRSRSGLIDQYVKFLLQWNLPVPTDILLTNRLWDALDRLAGTFEASGQVMPLAQAQKAVGDFEEAGQIINDLCERGLLATDGLNLRFWHQALQEYFYAGSVVRRWRGPVQHTGRMPRWLRRLAAKTEEEEALGFIVAHLHDEEAEAALRYGLAVNPALAIAWADDLCLEGRATPTTARFMARVRRFALASCRYMRFGNERWFIPLSLGLIGLVFGPLLALMLAGVIDSLFTLSDLADRVVLGCGILLGYLPLLDFLLRCPSVKKLESVLGAIPEIRDISLRSALAALARDISDAGFIHRDIRALAQGAARLEINYGEGLIEWLRTSDAPYTTTRFIGHLDAPFVVPLLAELLKLNNFLSPAALEALTLRANRLHGERPKAKRLLWEVWENKAMDCRTRRLARKLLLRMGESPGGWNSLFRYFTVRSLQSLALVLCLVVITISLPVGISFILWLGLPTVVFWDARRLGARRVEGRFESDTPESWFLGVLLAPYLAIPFYLLNRNRIRRDAAPVDWDAILEALEAKSDEGDNLSIHPSSAPSSRR